MNTNEIIKDLKYIFLKRESPNEKTFLVKKDPTRMDQKYQKADIIVKYIDNNTVIGFTYEASHTISDHDNRLKNLANDFLDKKNSNKNYLATTDGNEYKLKQVH